ncbi:MAG TPA: hypothetical protein VFU22_14950 [Roseiflexaceae bacterium]|nr:hypothetical protein [Roseiflexaceae bacterium]
MSTFVATYISAFAGILAPFRRMRPLCVASQPAKRTVMDAATYAAMVAEAERIAAPYQRHIAQQVAALEPPDADLSEADFPEVEALLMRAGLLSS